MRRLNKHVLALLCASVVSLYTTASTAQIAFTDVTLASGMTHGSESYGAAWGDLNGDGLLDLYASNHRTQDSLFLNRGYGVFVDVGAQTSDWLNRPTADTHGGTWADFNNDGAQDLLISTGSGLSELLVNENQRLVDRSAPLGMTTPNIDARMPIWLDYDRDRRLDVILMQYGAGARLYHQELNGAFIDTTDAANLDCVHSQYAQFLDVTGDGHLDLLCADERRFPQKIYDTTTFPFTPLFDSAHPGTLFPVIANVVDSAIADFNNDRRMDVFLLSGGQLRPSSVVQGEANTFEAMLSGGSKGFEFVASGVITLSVDWNSGGEGTDTDIGKIQIGHAGIHPAADTFSLNPADPDVAGMPPLPRSASDLPVMQMGYDPLTHRWTLRIVTRLTPAGGGAFTQAYIRASSTAAITELVSTGLWPTDGPSRPTLLMNQGGSFLDETDAAGLGAPVQCVSVTAGDFDNDMYVDLYLACRTGASNITNILYHNNHNGTFTMVPNAGAAAGPIGLALANGAGAADSVVTGDYDVDGFLDLFVTNGFNMRPMYVGGPSKLYHNNGNGNHWIELDLVGVSSDRDATGARVYATANGVIQMRVQDGRYHRWSQDAKRIHFGLAGASAVNIAVWWPNGTVQSFVNIPTDRLYRITENAAAPEPVTTGAARAYPCGSPGLNGAIDTGVFIWRDCASGAWQLNTAAAGYTNTFGGSVTSNAPLLSVVPVNLSPTDVVTSSPGANQVSFTFHPAGANTDGVVFVPQDGTSNCLNITLPVGAPVYFGPFRTAVAQNLNLDTQTPCP